MPEPTTSATDTLSTLRSALADRYQVEREIGAGGMATVYLAQEQRYDRRVAIKVLRPELAAAVGAERFLREIKVTAALQHPHILPLYDSGVAGGLIYYVMPYVEGESLRARLDRVKQLPLRDALEVARSVASALDYAHHRGVIHRDVKPENILLAGDARDDMNGLQALVADFGVAVAIETAGGHRLTASGLSVGTPAYMSPEQAAAERHLGTESDVYALGVVLYEMLTGEPPFTGPTAQAVVAKLMHELPPPMRSRRTTVPPRVEAAVMKSLEKTPADRYSSAARFAEALQLEGDAAVASGTRAELRRRGVSVALPWVLVAMLATVVGGLVVRNMRASAAASGRPDGPSHLAIILPEGQVVPNWLAGVSIGDQGRIFAFVAAGTDGRTAIYLKRLEQPNVTALPGTADGSYPVFSPDGKWLAFFSDGQLKKVLLSSGFVTTIADSVGLGSDAQWTRDGFILYGSSFIAAGVGIQRISENGGMPTRVTARDTARGEASHIGPQLLEDGRSLLYVARGSTRSGPFSRVMIRRTESSPPRVLIEGASVAKYVGGGRLVYQKESGLFVANLNLASLELTNDRPMLRGVAPMSAVFNGVPWALSEDVLVYGTPESTDRALVWVDRNGRGQPVPAPTRPFFGLKLSPDGHRVALATTGAKSDVWIYDLEQDILTRASDDGQTYGALWSPDGERLTTLSVTREGRVVSSRRPDGTVPERLLRNVFWPSAWTKDGRRLVVMDRGDLWIADIPNSGALRPLIHSAANELGGRLSPDERWLAYFSDATGAWELWVARFPEGEPSVRVSRTGAREAVWSRDGRELFFRSPNGRQVLSVAINPGTSFSFVPPRLVFEGEYFFLGGPGVVNYDVSQDGKRFLMLQRAGTGSGHLNVVLGWRRMIPTSGQ